jgi:hypothetical protein
MKKIKDFLNYIFAPRVTIYKNTTKQNISNKEAEKIFKHMDRHFKLIDKMFRNLDKIL